MAGQASAPHPPPRLCQGRSGADPDTDVLQSIARIKVSPFLPHTGEVRGFVFDVGNGRLTEVVR